jgi:hypothetical protein
MHYINSKSPDNKERLVDGPVSTRRGEERRDMDA